MTPASQLVTPHAPSKADSTAASAQAALQKELPVLLKYIHDLSDHVIRERTAVWEPGFHGMLLSDWNPEESRFQHPMSVVFVHDEVARVARNDSQSLPKHQLDQPLLPHYLIASSGDGNCVMRSANLSDVVRKAKSSKLVAIWNAIDSLRRDPQWGGVVQQSREAEKQHLTLYRSMSVHTHAHCSNLKSCAIDCLAHSSRSVCFQFVQPL